MAGPAVQPNPAQANLAVTSINPPNGATNVAINTRIVVTFNFPLIPASVDQNTFQVTPLGGIGIVGLLSASGTVATFTPSGLLSAMMTFQVTIVGGPNGVLGVNPSGGPALLLPENFPSTFTTGYQTSHGAFIAAASGGKVTDLFGTLGAETRIPRQTLKVDAYVKVLTLSSPERMGQVDRSCDVPLSPSDTFPDVPGFIRITEVVRVEVQPCGSIAFGPGMTLKLPLLRGFKGKLPTGFPLQLYQLGRDQAGALVFRDTGLTVKVSGGFLFGNFATVPGIQPFGTYAAFAAPPLPTKKQAGLEPSSIAHSNSGLPATTQAGALAEGGVLYFSVVINDPVNKHATRLSIANPDPSNPLTVNLAAYDSSGVQRGSATLTIAGGGQTTQSVSSLFPTLDSGAIVANASSGSMTGFSEIADDFSRPATWASVEAIRSPQSALVFPAIDVSDNSFTEIYIFNPDCDRNSGAVEVSLRAFKKDGTPVDLVDSNGMKVTSVTLNACGGLVMASDKAPVDSRDVRIPSELNEGYILVQSSDGQKTLVGTELFGQIAGGKVSLAMLNGLSFPSGCLLANSTDDACHVDASPQGPVPDAARQHTLYAPYFESSPASAELIVVNTSTAPARFALSAFRENGSFRAANPDLASNPRSPFTILGPYQVMRIAGTGLFPFNPAPGYARIEDPDSAMVGVIINRDADKYTTAIPLAPDIPELAQTTSDTFLSRIQLDPPSANPRITTGLIILNANNNSVQFEITLRETSSAPKTSLHRLSARSVFIRTRDSLSVLFSSSRGGQVEVRARSLLGPGEGGHLMMVGIYRLKTSGAIQTACTISEQVKSP